MNTAKISMFAFLAATVAFTANAEPSLAAGLPASSYSQSASLSGATAFTAFNGGGWSAGSHGTHWIEVDLGSPQLVGQVSFFTGQLPNGTTWQSIYLSDSAIGASWTSLTPVASRSGFTTSGTPVTLEFEQTSGQYLSIVANGGPSWTSLSDVVVSAVPEPAAYVLMMGGMALLGLAVRRRRLD